jgi:hypothetical protein
VRRREVNVRVAQVLCLRVCVCVCVCTLSVCARAAGLCLGAGDGGGGRSHRVRDQERPAHSDGPRCPLGSAGARCVGALSAVPAAFRNGTRAGRPDSALWLCLRAQGWRCTRRRWRLCSTSLERSNKASTKRLRLSPRATLTYRGRDPTDARAQRGPSPSY